MKIACKERRRRKKEKEKKISYTNLSGSQPNFLPSVKSSDITYHFPNVLTLLISKFNFLCLAGNVGGKQFSLYGLTLNALV